MHRSLTILILGIVLAAAAWSQDAGDDPGDESVDGGTESAANVDDDTDANDASEEIEEAGLDEQDYIDTDDDFRPSEEISTDQSIAFPTDI